VRRLAHYEGRRSKPRKTAEAVLAAHAEEDTWKVAMFFETRLREETVRKTARARRSRKTSGAPAGIES
jgi:hypothetical protein